MLPSGLSEQVDDAESLARFLTSDSQFNRVGAKASAFMPGPADSSTSVFRQGAEPPEDLWLLAEREVGHERRARGAALVMGADVRSVGLEPQAVEPPPRHVNIVGWPAVENDVELTRAQRRERALLLASKAVLIVR